ncbi:MAG: DNA-binding domain-containing protein [Rhodobacteraceae bacterium]|nr:DNA-binding domain-containing protein [Paracoccaceae bacterium]
MTTPATTFIEAVLDPGQPVPTPVVSGTSATERRFAVYRNNVVVSLIKALESAYPVIGTLVGAEFFRAMAGEFVRQYPPRTPLMMEFAMDFPEFLDSFEPVAHLPYLADVSRIERALRQSYHAADSTALTEGDLEDIDTANLADVHVELAPAFRLLASPWPVFSIWDDTTRGVRRNPPKESQAVAITRTHFDPAVRLLLPGEWRLLSHLMQNRTLGAAIAAAAQSHAGFALQDTLAWLLDTGTIIKLSAVGAYA